MLERCEKWLSRSIKQKNVGDSKQHVNTIVQGNKNLENGMRRVFKGVP